MSTRDVLHSTNNEIVENTSEKGYKYPIKVNENIAIGLFKESFIKILIEPNRKIREKKLLLLQAAIGKHILPIRNLKSTDRVHNLSNKYKNNQKDSVSASKVLSQRFRFKIKKIPEHQ